MGDVADMMLDGTLCEGCGVANTEGMDKPDWESQGFPWYCDSCAEELDYED